jgi:hypothetical protein
MHLSVLLKSSLFKFYTMEILGISVVLSGRYDGKASRCLAEFVIPRHRGGSVDVCADDNDKIMAVFGF